MHIILLIVVGSLAVLFLAAVLLSTRSVIARVTASLFAVGLAAFCVFGFLASFEPSDAPNWPWQLAYGILGVCSLGTSALLVVQRGRRANPEIEGAN